MFATDAALPPNAGTATLPALEPVGCALLPGGEWRVRPPRPTVLVRSLEGRRTMAVALHEPRRRQRPFLDFAQVGTHDLALDDDPITRQRCRV